MRVLKSLVEMVTGRPATPLPLSVGEYAAAGFAIGLERGLAQIAALGPPVRPTTPADGFLCPALERVDSERVLCLDSLPCSAHRIDTPHLGLLMWGSIYREGQSYAG
jgi:hypothetical protein